MVEHCRKRGVLLMEAFMWRHQPRTHGVARACPKRGDRRASLDSFLVLIPDRAGRLAPRSRAGRRGPVRRRLLRREHGPVVRGERTDKATAIARFGDSGVDLSLTASVEFPGGVLATIDCSFEQPFRCSYELVGSRGVIDVPDAYLPPAADKPIARLRTIGRRPTRTPVPTRFGSSNSSRLTSMRPWSMRSQIRSIAGRLVPPAENGLAQMQILDRLIARRPVPAALNESPGLVPGSRSLAQHLGTM